MTAAVARNKELVTNAEYLPPTDPVEFEKWKIIQEKKLETELLEFLIKFVHNQAKWMRMLEDRLVNLVCCKVELYKCDIRHVMMVDNFQDMAAHIKKKIMNALDDRHEDEKNRLEQKVKEKIAAFTTAQLEELPAAGPKPWSAESLAICDRNESFARAASVAIQDRIDSFTAGAETALKEKLTDLQRDKVTTKKDVEAAMKSVMVRVAVLWAKTSGCMNEIPQELLEAYNKIMW
jgi:hypothetical protein